MLLYNDKLLSWLFQLGEVGFDQGCIGLDDVVIYIDLKIVVELLQQVIFYDQIVVENDKVVQVQVCDIVGVVVSKVVVQVVVIKDDCEQKLDEVVCGMCYQFCWIVSGYYQGVVVKGIGCIGVVLVLQSSSQLFLVQVCVQVGDIYIGLVGMLIDLLYFGVFDLYLWFVGISMVKFYLLFGVILFDICFYVICGCLSVMFGDYGNQFCYWYFCGWVGLSDFFGDFVFVIGGVCFKFIGDM